MSDVRSFILGTDWWTDCDDAVALRMLSRSHLDGEISLLGIAINACMDASVASLDGFLTLEGVRGIPLGIDLDATDFGGAPPYQKKLAPYASTYRSNADAEDAVRLYRRLLARAKEPIELIEIGYPQVLSALLESRGDDLSSLSGEELMRQRVSHVWMMAGKWDRDGEKENNFARNARSRRAGEKFCRICPVPITFLGWEIGADVITGGGLPAEDPLHRVLCDHGSPDGRMSWDPMLVELALVGDPDAAGYDVVSGRASVDGESGANHFAPTESGLHRYVIRTRDPIFYRNQIHKRIF